MLSDESSSDSETGRFKGRSKTQEDQSSRQKSDNARDGGRSRHSGNDRFQRNFDRRREERDQFEKHSRDRDRHRFSRHSPVSRRRHSRDRSPNRRSHDRSKHRESSDRGKIREHRSSSKDIHNKHSASRSYISHDNRKEPKEETRRNTVRDRSAEKQTKKLREKTLSPVPRAKREKSLSPVHRGKREKSLSPVHRGKREKTLSPVHRGKREKSLSPVHRGKREKSLSPVQRGKRSEIYRPPPAVEKRGLERKKSDSPIIIEENDHSDHEEVQLGSYYNMIPAVIKEKSDESSEIDSSDDERLRAKLLNLEKELHKTKKQKKHKKKHKRKSSKSSKDRELNDSSVSVEVSSTTDIKVKPDVSDSKVDVVEEVSSTQKNAQKDSCEEGEISSDDSQSQIDIDPTDLRHKLRRTIHKSDDKSKVDVCGPALPPHLEKQNKRSASPDIEGPALPPHLQRSKNIGPAIPDDIRKVLAEREVIKYESSDDDSGIGPLPAGSEEKWSDAHRRLEERALDIKIKNLDGHETKVKSREQWMLELPEGKAKYIGLEARSFRAKEGPDMSDRSSWTDTPEEKARKAAGEVKEEDLDSQLKAEARMRHIANRDDEQESAVKKHKKKHKRDESLLEMHQKKLKKKKKKEEKDDGKKERRPFSRDVDLQVNRFDEAQKRSIIKKAQDLNTRFGRGEAKYL